MTIHPYANTVLAVAVEDINETESGLIVKENKSKLTQKFKVIEIGTGLENNNKNTINKGDIILAAKYGPKEFSIEGKTYFVAREDDIFSVIKN